MPLITPPYHITLVVADVEAAKEDLGRVLGLSWGKTQNRRVTTDSPARGVKEIVVCYAYSLNGPPYLELVQQVPDSIFAELGLHHIGIWCSDFVEESARLEAEGWPRECVNVTPEGEWMSGLFHRGPSGLRVEVIDIANSGPRLVKYLNGGDYRPQNVG